MYLKESLHFLTGINTSFMLCRQPMDNNGGALGGDGKTKRRPRDIYGRPLPTEEEFEVLKNAPKMDTGIQGRAKPFGIEIRNVKCLRCGNFGHQSGDRECPLKDVIMPNEEKRLQRDDPLNAIIAQSDAAEPLKWELKQKPGFSPPRGGYNPDDPNQQIVAEEIFDEYGGFLVGGDIPDLLANFTAGKHEKKSKRKSKHKKRSYASLSDSSLSASDSEEKKSKSEKRRQKSKKSKKVKSTEKKRSEHSDSDEDFRSKRTGIFESHDHVKKGKLKKGSEHCDPDGEIRRKTRNYLSEFDKDNKGKHHQGRQKSSYSLLTGNDRIRSRDKKLDSDSDNGESSKNHKFKRRLFESEEVDKFKHRDRSASDEDHRRERKIDRDLHTKSSGSNGELKSGHSAVDGLIERWHENLSEPDEDNHRSKNRRRQGKYRNQHPDSGANIEIKNDDQHYGKDHRAESRHLQDIRHRSLHGGEEHKTRSTHTHPVSYNYHDRGRYGREQSDDSNEDKHQRPRHDCDHHRAVRRQRQ
uniref:Zinc knuckle domain-containing protein n=1 Tax=Kalanchoe fedtschenkoi TaxID=63787 RepID=A0A7N0V571_KALFE